MRLAHVATVDLTLRFLLLNQLKAFRRAGFEVAGISAPGPWTADLEREGIAHHAVPALGRGMNPLADLRAVRELITLFRRERFTIVHTHMPKSGVLGRLAARLSRVPIIVNTVHGLIGNDPSRPARRWFYLTLERLGGRASHFEFSQSRENLELLRRLGIFHPERSAFLGNGIDLEHFDPDAVPPPARERLRAELGIAPQSTVVGTVGRLVWEKGYREFLDAAEQVRATRPEVAFVAVGPADDAKPDALTQAAVGEAEARGIRFLGMRTDMRELYSLMDIFVLPSYREGFPRSAIEAAAMRKALILTDIPGCREVVTHEENGLLVPAREAGPLAAAIVTMVDDEALRRRFGEAGRRKAAAEFDERVVIERELNVYRALLDQTRAPAHQAIGSESPAGR